MTLSNHDDDFPLSIVVDAHFIEDPRKATVFVVDDVDVPMKAYVMAVLRGGCLLSASVLKGDEGLKIQYSQQKFRAQCRKLPSMFCSEDFKSCEPALTQILRWAVSEKFWAAVRLEDVKRNTICMISGNNDPQMRGCKSKSNCCMTSKQLVTLLTKNCIDYQDSFRVKARRGT